MDNYEVMQGVALPIGVALIDDEGRALVDYVGVEALDAEAWPGGARRAAFRLDARWVDPPAGQVLVVVGSDQTGALAPGRYQGALFLQDPTYGRVEAYRWSFEVLAGPGPLDAPEAAEAAEVLYCDGSDVEDAAAGSWLRSLQLPADEAGYRRAIRRASRWLDDLILAAAPGTPSRLQLADQGFGGLAYGSGPRPSAYIRERLEAGGLEVRDWVREAVSLRALHLICRGQADKDYIARAARYKFESYNLAAARVAEIRVGGPDDPPALFVHLGSGSLR